MGGANLKNYEQRIRSYFKEYADDVLNSQYYRDPLSTVGNRSILKEAKQNYADNLEAINNRAVAGGATMENQLAARQANNENLDKLYGRLLQNEDARRDAITGQRLNLKGQQANDTANSYYQAAKDWQSWGSQIGNAALSYGSANLLDSGNLGGLGSTLDKGEMASQLRDAVYPYNKALVTPAGVKTPSLVNTAGLGGLKK